MNAVKIRRLLQRIRRAVREPLIRLVFRALAFVSLRINQQIGQILGWLMWKFSPRSVRISRINIEHCFPELSPGKQNELVRSSLIETGKTMTEISAFWCWEKNRVLDLVKEINGKNLLEEAYAQGRGLVVLTPHLGAWELAGLYLCAHYPTTVLYQPSEMQSIEPIIQKGRTRFGGQLVPTDINGVRQLFRALKNGEVLGILPDQDPGRNSGEFAPFFGIPTNTMTLVSRLVEKNQTPVIICYAERLADAKGYNIHYSRLDMESQTDLVDSLTRLNAGVEALVRQTPAQYQWSYKRFRTRPDPRERFY